jgi:hypothetical protein
VTPTGTGASLAGFFITWLVVLGVVGGGATFALVWFR